MEHYTELLISCIEPESFRGRPAGREPPDTDFRECHRPPRESSGHTHPAEPARSGYPVNSDFRLVRSCCEHPYIQESPCLPHIRRFPEGDMLQSIRDILLPCALLLPPHPSWLFTALTNREVHKRSFTDLHCQLHGQDTSCPREPRQAQNMQPHISSGKQPALHNTYHCHIL